MSAQAKRYSKLLAVVIPVFMAGLSPFVRWDPGISASSAPAAYSVSGVVTDDAGLPLGGVMVYASPRGSSVFTDSLGGFTLGSLQQGQYILFAEKHGYSEGYMRITAGNDIYQQVTFEMARLAGSLSGRLKDNNGRGLSGAVITLAGTDFTTVSGPDGSYFLNDIPAGEHTAGIRLPGKAVRYFPIIIYPEQSALLEPDFSKDMFAVSSVYTDTGEEPAPVPLPEKTNIYASASGSAMVNEPPPPPAPEPKQDDVKPLPKPKTPEPKPAPRTAVQPGSMVLVTGGSFVMGDTEGTGLPDEKPTRTVTVKDFYMDATEVTVAQYREFCTATGRPMPAAPPWGWVDIHPMVNVSWEDANAYAKWAGKRLPTEAEWEFAARGGSSPASGEQPGSAWISSNSAGSPRPVGSSTPNALGIYDLRGNVWEWCADWYYSTSYASADNELLKSGRFKSLRGGSFEYSAYYARVSVRHYSDPAFWSNGFGFRCAKDAP